MSADDRDRRERLAAIRERRARREREALHAATAFQTLTTTVEAARTGAFDAGDPTPGATAVAHLADGFAPLERAALRDATAALAERSERYRPTRLAAALGEAGDAYERRDRLQFVSALRTVFRLFDRLDEDAVDDRTERELRRSLRRLVDLYRRTSDDPRFDETLDDIDALYERAFATGVAPHVDAIRDLFGDAHEVTVSGHLADFETANANDDDAAVDDALDALKTAFLDRHEAITAARTSALTAAIDADEDASVDAGIDRYRNRLRDARDRVAATDDRLNDLLDAYVRDLPTDVDAVLEDLADADPVLLLPVQLETRFARNDAGDVSALQIRVYPDDVHVDSHEPALAPGERELGVRFWAHLWWASHALDAGDLADAVGTTGPVADAFALADLGSLPSDHGDRYRSMKARAWSNLVDRLGEERGAWVKAATAPPAAAAAALLDGPLDTADVPAVDFDALGTDVGTRPDSWTRAPRARLLPDRWIAFVDDGTDVRTLVGEPIPEPLAVGPGPDPVAAVVGDAGDAADTGTLDGDEDASWLVDLERAREVGMAMETTLTDADVPADGLDVVVVGVRTSASETDTAVELRDLLDAHHYTDGLGFLSPGTPTNATTEGATPFSSTDDAAATLPIECGPSLVAGTDAASVGRDAERDGSRAARLLGIDPERLGDPAEAHVFAHVPGAEGTENADARQMNVALWSATWGTYAPNMLLPGRWVGTDAGEYDAFLRWLGGFREHFVEHVRAGGPLPSLRVGHQPYGLLPTTSLESWGALPVEAPDPELPASPTEPVGDGYDPRRPEYPVVSGLLRDVLHADSPLDPGLLSLWEDSTANVPRIGSENTTEELLRMLSMSATAYGYRGHDLFGLTALWQAITGTPSPPPGFGSYFTDLLDDIVTDPGTRTLLAAFGVERQDHPRIVNLLYRASLPVHYGATSGPLEPLVSPDMRDHFDALQRDPPWMLALWWRIRLGTDLDLRRQSLPARIDALYGELTPEGADSLLGVLLQYATMQEYAMARIRLDRRFRNEKEVSTGADPQRLWELLPEPELYEASDESLLDLLDDRIPAALAEHPDLDAESTFLEALVVAGNVTDPALEVDPTFRTFVESLRYFAERDPEAVDLERLFTETMDLATHRVDAWTTSLATRRLETIRAVQAAGDGGGVHVGGYGTVTGLKPATRGSEGYLHAPSLAQSTTAAVLRSGHLAMEGARRDLLALDLSAERVRTAKELLDGLRTGQSLGALLGYRFERELHERGLNVYVPEFRRLAPSVAGKLERGGDEPDVETTTDTVDGLSLFRRYARRGPFADAAAPIPWGERVDDEASVEPLPSDDPSSPTHATYLEIDAALERLDWTVDAVRDVLVAEGVHGLVTGRPMQGGASLDALARGESPPELTFTETPRSGVGVTHRLLVLFDEPTDGDSAPGWIDTERGAAEPVLNAWFASLLPLPDEVACLCELDAGDGTPPTPIVVTLADLAVAPMDLVTAGEDGSVTQRSTLEERVRYRVSRARGLDGDTTLTLRFDRPTAWVDDHAVDAFERIDPADSVPTVGELVEVSAVLELVRAGHELVAGGRPADATDLTLPGATTNDGRDASILAARADAAAQALADARAAIAPSLGFLRPRVPDESAADTPGTDAAEAPLSTQPSTVERLETVGDRLRAFPTAAELDPVRTALTGIDEPAVFDALASFAAAFDADLVAIDAVDGSVRLEAAADQEVSGSTVATPGTKLTLRLEGADRFAKETVTVAPDGSFAVAFDLTDAAVGSTFSITVRTALEPVVAVDGEVVSTATETPTPTTLSPPDVEALESYREPADALRGLEAEGAALATAVNAVDATELVTTLSARPWNHLSTLADWRAAWRTDAPTQVQAVLDLEDLRLPGTGPATTGDPWDSLAALLDLLDERGASPLAYDSEECSALVAALDAILDGADRTAWATSLEALHSAFATDLAALATAVTHGPASIDAAAFALVEAIRDGLVQAAELVGGSVPRSPNGLPTGGDREALIGQAQSVDEALATRIEAVGETGATDAESQLARLEAVFGAAFPVVPPFSPTNPDELDLAFTEAHSATLRGDDVMAAETWFERASRLREQPSALGDLLTYASVLDADGEAVASRFRLGQLPYRPDDRWVGLPDAFDEDRPGGRLSLVVHPALGAEATPHAGLFVDEWVEVVPEATETTGVAFHYDQPQNRPPQSLLLAVPPDDQGWRMETLKDVIDETLALARMRTVDTDALREVGHFLPALVYAATDNRPGTPDRVAVDFDHLEVPEGGE